MVKQNVEPEAKYKLLTIPLDKKHYGDQSTQHEEAQSRWENNSSATQWSRPGRNWRRQRTVHHWKKSKQMEIETDGWKRSKQMERW